MRGSKKVANDLLWWQFFPSSKWRKWAARADLMYLVLQRTCSCSSLVTFLWCISADSTGRCSACAAIWVAGCLSRRSEVVCELLDLASWPSLLVCFLWHWSVLLTGVKTGVQTKPKAKASVPVFKGKPTPSLDCSLHIPQTLGLICTCTSRNGGKQFWLQFLLVWFLFYFRQSIRINLDTARQIPRWLNLASLQCLEMGSTNLLRQL